MRTRKQTTLSKIIAIVLVAALVMAMNLTAFAAISDNAKVTVSGLENGVTVTAHKIIEMNVEQGQPKEPVYLWNAQVADWLKSYTEDGGTPFAGYVGAGNAVTESFQELDNESSSLKHVIQELAKAIRTDSTNFNSVNNHSVAAAGESTDINLSVGQYLLTAAGGDKIYLPTTIGLFPTFDDEEGDWSVENAEVTMKGQLPTIAKTPDKPTVAVGDIVTYTLDVTVPVYPEDAVAPVLEVGDKLGTGLTLDTDTIQVKRKDGTDIDASNYTLTTENAVDKKGNSRSFLINFTSDFLYDTQYAGQEIEIIYEAKVNTNAFAENALQNEAFLGYNHDPYNADSYDVTPEVVDVYTYGIAVNKKDMETQESLGGAEFTIKKRIGETLGAALTFSGADGTYTYDPTSSVSTVAVSEGGVLQLRGLDAGVYVLEETKAPDGYVLPNGFVTISIVDGDGNTTLADGTLDLTSSATTDVEGLIGKDSLKITNNVLSLDVMNSTTEFGLPETGGMGTAIYTIIGILLMGGAVALVVASRRKRTER